jgi:hypothetical protein
MATWVVAVLSLIAAVVLMQSKRQRIEDRRETAERLLGRMDMTSLRKILEAADVHYTRAELLRTNLHILSSIAAEDELPLVAGGSFTWKYAEPSLLLSALVDRSPTFAALIDAALDAFPCSAANPWHIALAFDEYIPGDRHSLDNRRKVLNIGFTFCELHRHVHKDNAWIIPAVIRSSKLKLIQGKHSAALNAFLMRMLFGEFGFTTSGAVIRHRNRDVPLFARMAVIFSDLDGIRAAYDWKGANSMRPCLMCCVFKKDAGLDLPDGEDLIDVTSHESERFLSEGYSRTIDDFDRDIALVIEAHQRSERGEMTKSRAKNIAMSVGMNPNPNGMLANPRMLHEVMVTEILVTDWMHNFLQEGTMSVELTLILDACEGLGLSKSTFAAIFDADWRVPLFRQQKNNFLQVIFQYADEHGSDIKCSASELLALYSIVRYSVAIFAAGDGLDPAFAPKLESFYAACRCIDIILRLKTLDGSDPRFDAVCDDLAAATRLHLQLHKAAYGVDHIKPKHHQNFHLAPQFKRYRRVWDCFVMERLHLRVKHVAEPVRNTTSFEESVIAGALHRHFRCLDDSDFADGLKGGVTRHPDFPNAELSSKLEFRGMVVSITDFVALDANTIGEVRACIKYNGILFVHPYVSPCWLVFCSYDTTCS